MAEIARASPSPPREERAGERRPFSQSGQAVHGLFAQSLINRSIASQNPLGHLFRSHYIARVKVETLEAALQARPFRPFALRVDGEVIHVKHPEQVLLAEHKSTVVVDVGHRIHIMDCSYISKPPLLRRQNVSVKRD